MIKKSSLLSLIWPKFITFIESEYAPNYNPQNEAFRLFRTNRIIS